MGGTVLDGLSHRRVSAPHPVTAAGAYLVATPPSGTVHRGVAACRRVAGFSCQKTTDFSWYEVHEVGCVGRVTPFSHFGTALTVRNAWASMVSVMCRHHRM